MTNRAINWISASVAAFACASPSLAIDEAHYRQARQMIEKSIDYLRAQQDPATGGWAVAPQGPKIPAISALVLNGLLMEPDIDPNDPTVERGVDFILSFQQPDGGIYDQILANYNTALSVSALSRVNTARAGDAIEKAIPFLRKLQWSEDSNEMKGETGKVDQSHPFYGGVGYGSHGRPDNSNLNLMLQALHDAGVDCDDEAFQRAVVFLQRTQMVDEFNDQPYADGTIQGGFIYATAENTDTIGQGESKAGMIEETLDDGTRISRLRAYGSITYAGFKSYIYANLDRDDPRVQAAYHWISENYTLDENPGVGTDGLYYYFVTFSRALDAWGMPTLDVAVGDQQDISMHYDFPLQGAEPWRLEASEGETESGETITFEQPVHSYEWVPSKNLLMSSTEAGAAPPNDVGKLADGRKYKLVGRQIRSITNNGTGTVNFPIRFVESRDWANDLIDRLATLQNDDGSFKSVDSRWMEDNPVLITAYALLALQHAID